MTRTQRRNALLLILAAAVAVGPLARAQTPRTRSPEAQHAIAEQITVCTEDQRQMFASGLRRPQYLLFCNCYVYSATDAIDDDEVAYRRAHDNAPSPRFVEISGKLIDACIREARTRVPN
jgi:hypothetical protein